MTCSGSCCPSNGWCCCTNHWHQQLVACWRLCVAYPAAGRRHVDTSAVLVIMQPAPEFARRGLWRQFAELVLRATHSEGYCLLLVLRNPVGTICRGSTMSLRCKNGAVANSAVLLPSGWVLPFSQTDMSCVLGQHSIRNLTCRLARLVWTCTAHSLQ